jgi:hypothetical protein
MWQRGSSRSVRNNRLPEYAIDGENFSQTSSRQLEGESSPAVYDVWYKRVPCGHYIAVARVSRLDRSFTAREEFRLLGAACLDGR